MSHEAFKLRVKSQKLPVQPGVNNNFNPFFQRQNFRLAQIENICRRHNKCDLKIEI